jgi:hypothetical protein
MTAISAKTVTAAQVEAGLTDEWCYSDAFKEVYGYRPRGEYLNKPGYVAEFWNRFDELLAVAKAEEEEALAIICARHGIVATTWSSYYDQREEQDYLRYQEERAAAAEATAEKAEYFRRGSPAPVLEAWAYGE